MTPDSVRKLILKVDIVAMVILGAVIQGAGISFFVLSPLNRPAEAPPLRPVVEAYLDDVATGDAAGALAMTQVDDRTFDGESTGLLVDEALRGARERITDPQVEAVDEHSFAGSTARATVVYRLAGEQHEAKLTWRHNEDTNEWRVVDGLIRTLIVEGLPGHTVPFQLAGVTPEPKEVCHGEGDEAWCGPASAYAVFAGVYELRADLSGFEVHPHNTTAAEQLVTIMPGALSRVSYLAVPRGEPWPIVNGKSIDPSPDEG